MPTPHKHAAVIKAWADGAEIEVREPGGPWRKPLENPLWFTDREYRVKPKPHKWQKEIDAFYVEKKTIQCRKVGTSTWNTWTWDPGTFEDSSRRPDWRFDDSIFEFRIKPEPVACYGRVTMNDVEERQGFGLTFSFPYGKTATKGGQDNLKLTFEDGVLVAAEVLK